MSPSDIFAIVVIVSPSLCLLPVVFRSQRGIWTTRWVSRAFGRAIQQRQKKSRTFFFLFLSRSNPLLYPDTPKKCWKLSVIVCNTPRLKHTTCRDERTCCNNFQITTERKKKKWNKTREEETKKKGQFLQISIFYPFFFLHLNNRNVWHSPVTALTFASAVERQSFWRKNEFFKKKGGLKQMSCALIRPT